MAHVPMMGMPWTTIYFGSALHGLPSPVAVVFNRSGGGSDRSVPPETLQPEAGARHWGNPTPPPTCSRCAHQHFPKGPRHNQYRNDPGEHHFHSAPANSSHALCRKGAPYITSHQNSRWDYDLTRPSRLRSNPVNIIYRGNRIFSTLPTVLHYYDVPRENPGRCLSARS